jgi:hypothetical protein
MSMQRREFLSASLATGRPGRRPRARAGGGQDAGRREEARPPDPGRHGLPRARAGRGGQRARPQADALQPRQDQARSLPRHREAARRSRSEQGRGHQGARRTQVGRGLRRLRVLPAHGQGFGRAHGAQPGPVLLRVEHLLLREERRRGPDESARCGTMPDPTVEDMGRATSTTARSRRCASRRREGHAGQDDDRAAGLHRRAGRQQRALQLLVRALRPRRRRFSCRARPPIRCR